MIYLQIGVISDTHGLLRPEVIAALAGSSLIIHAGDVGGPEILATLETIAPVVAVRGNVDRGTWARKLPETEVVEVEQVRLYVLHDLALLDLDPAAAGFHGVISGHSHKPSVVRRQQVLFINPGSAGPRRFKLPISVGQLQVKNGRLEPKLISLEA